MQYTDVISKYANSQGSRLAVYDLTKKRGLNYLQFNGLIQQAVAYLKANLKSVENERIAILSRNNVEQLAFMYAAIRLGAIFVPLNWRLTSHELDVLLDDCKPALVLCQKEFSSQINVPHELFDDFWDNDPPPSFEPAPQSDPNKPAIILYTSGTTGKPKGVIITLGNAIASSENFVAVAQADEGTVSLCDSPMFHTMGLIAISRSTLHCGGTVYISSAFHPAETIERIANPELGVTHYFCVPQMTQMMRQDENFAPEKFKGLKAMFVGGAPVSKELAKRWFDDGIKLINGYGTSETGTAIHNRLDDEFGLTNRAHTIGKPAPLIEVSIRDENGKELSAGECGEIWMRGPNVSIGYWQNDAATKAAFQDGWYKSGDGGLFDNEGYFSITDRMKDMYISGGENVYPAEVEGIIADLACIKEAAVVGIKDEKWGEVGVAFIVKAPDSTLDEAQIMKHCREMLAGYKIPKIIRFMPALPRTGSGKVQKELLKLEIKNQ